MSNITVRIPTPLRPFVDDAPVLDADADTVGAALQQIGARHPGFLQRVVVGEGELRPYVNVFIGSENVSSTRRSATVTWLASFRRLRAVEETR
jgi:hypothetical protein